MPYAPETHANVFHQAQALICFAYKVAQEKVEKCGPGFLKRNIFFSSGLECILKTSKL